jgi:putative MATE family efflux protein
LSTPPDESGDHEFIGSSSAIESDASMVTLALDEAEALPQAEGSIRSGKLAGKSMWAAIWILALPVLVQQAAAACLGLSDKVLAGNLPDDIVVAALDGLGIGSYVGWFIGIAMTGLGIGGQALIARAMGGGDRSQAHRSLGHAMSLCLIWGAIVGAIMWFGAPPVAHFCRLSEDATFYCVQYIQILAYSMPFCGVMMVGSMCLYGAGETAKPSAIVVFVNIVNVLFSWALSGADIRWGQVEIINPFSFDLDVAGIAAGTAISYFVGAILIVITLRRGVKDLHLELPDLRLEWPMIARIVRIGVPSFCEGISMWAVNLIVLMFIGKIAVRDAGGEGLQGAHIIAVQWEAFSFLPGFAIGTAAGALAGQYLGAGNPRMAQKAILGCTGLAMAVMGSMGVIFMLFGHELTRVISDEPVHLEHVPRLLFICGTMQVFFAVTMVVRQGLRGVGDTLWTFIITTVSSYGCRMPAAWLLGVHFGLGLEGIWIGLCGEFIVRASLFAARFFHGGWKRLKV